MGTRIQDKDHGYKAMRQRMKQMAGSYTKVGVQENSRDQDGVSDLVIIAASNEFGTETIPERSFVRSTFEENREKLAEISAAEGDAILTGKKDVKTSLALMGEFHAGQIQAKIHSHPPPANAPSTIKRKGSSGTLVDSGNLAQSIRHVEIIEGRAQ